MTLTVTDASSNTATVSQPVTVSGVTLPGGGGGPAPIASRLRFSPAAFTAARNGPSMTTLGQSPTSRNHTAHRCTRIVKLLGSFTQAGQSGTNSLHFTGRLNGHKLKSGAYTLLATPTANGKIGHAVTIRFRIVG